MIVSIGFSPSFEAYLTATTLHIVRVSLWVVPRLTQRLWQVKHLMIFLERKAFTFYWRALVHPLGFCFDLMKSLSNLSVAEGWSHEFIAELKLQLKPN